MLKLARTLMSGAAIAALVSACGAGSDVAAPMSASAGPSRSGGSGGGGGTGTVTPPSTCVAEISSFVNTPGYGPYRADVADITTKATVKNCTGSAVNWLARVTYRGPFWGGTTFAFPLTCAMAIAANGQGTCQTKERYIFIRNTYSVILDVLDANGIVLATSSARVDTPSVPNPAFTPGS